LIPQGRFIFLDPRGGVDADGNPNVLDLALNTGVVNDIGHLARFDPNNPTGGDFHAFSTADRFNYRPYNYLLTPNRRVNVFGKAERDITSDILLSFTGSYTNRRSNGQAAPNPLALGSDAGSGFYLDNIVIPANQPYNPFGMALSGTSNLITLGRRPLEAGPRMFEQDVDTFLLSGVLSGKQEIADKPIFWDVGFSWGRNTATDLGRNIFNSRKLALALGDPAVCNATPGCVPFNIFGGQGADGSGSITPEMLQWATFTQHNSSEQELNDIALNISGDLFSLPAGALGYAFGFEHRKESGSFVPDAAVQGGETADVPASSTEGQVQVNELYLELNVPVVADLPFAKRVELSAAVRSSDYDRFGRDEVYKGGLYWRMTTDFSLRYNYAQGFRAPNIGELFNTGSRFDSAISDPCSQYLTKAAPNIQANCQALGVPGSFVQQNQQISVQTGGNLNLTPEKSNTWTAGFAYSPSWASDLPFVENLTFDFNYYDITLKQAIQALDAGNQLNACVSTLDPLFCNGIVRGAGGGIIAFANQLTNIGRVETEGFDATVTVASEETRFGQFRISWSNTYLGGYKEFTPGPNGDVVTERAGTEIGSPTKGLVRYKSALTTDLQVATFTPSLVVRYISGIRETCPKAIVDAGLSNLCSDLGNSINELGSRFYVDASVGWTPPIMDDRLNVGVGVNNLLDKDPPLCRSCDLNSYDGTIYPIPGRFVFARANVKF
jgi:iron complex outermembrane receptor protein